MTTKTIKQFTNKRAQITAIHQLGAMTHLAESYHFCFDMNWSHYNYHRKIKFILVLDWANRYFFADQLEKDIELETYL